MCKNGSKEKVRKVCLTESSATTELSSRDIFSRPPLVTKSAEQKQNKYEKAEYKRAIVCARHRNYGPSIAPLFNLTPVVLAQRLQPFYLSCFHDSPDAFPFYEEGQQLPHPNQSLSVL